jgi:hypothetical protein
MHGIYHPVGSRGIQDYILNVQLLHQPSHRKKKQIFYIWQKTWHTRHRISRSGLCCIFPLKRNSTSLPDNTRHAGWRRQSVLYMTNLHYCILRHKHSQAIALCALCLCAKEVRDWIFQFKMRIWKYFKICTPTTRLFSLLDKFLLL